MLHRTCTVWFTMCLQCLRSLEICVSFPAKVCVKLMCIYINFIFFIVTRILCVSCALVILCIRYVHVHTHVGVEKNNDDSKRHYFSSNKMDAAAEIVRCDYRLEAMRQGVWGHPSCHREKRKYTQRDDEYWNNGGIQEARKKARERED